MGLLGVRDILAVTPNTIATFTSLSYCFIPFYLITLLSSHTMTSRAQNLVYFPTIRNYICPTNGPNVYLLEVSDCTSVNDTILGDEGHKRKSTLRGKRQV